MSARFVVGYLAGVATLAAIDGALLSGIAAVVTATGGIVLGLMAYRRGLANGSGGDGWKALAKEREREIRRLEGELDRRNR